MYTQHTGFPSRQWSPLYH